MAVGEGSGGRVGERKKEREEGRGGETRGLGLGGKRKERGMRENLLGFAIRQLACYSVTLGESYLNTPGH